MKFTQTISSLGICKYPRDLNFHTMLLTVGNLIEYLNSKYFKDIKIEKEENMTSYRLI